MTLSGDWQCYLSRFGKEFTVLRLQLTSLDDQLTGFLDGIHVEGSLIKDKFSLVGTTPAGNEWGILEGVLKGEVLEGTMRRGGTTAQWKALRSSLGPDEPQIHEFNPSSYSHLFSGDIEPSLHVSPGDTIKTFLLDAGGWDSMRVERSYGGNPQTGPFFVEGALPGDTLVIRLRRILLNRCIAVCGNHITPDLLQPSYRRERSAEDSPFSEWLLDPTKGTGRLARPTKRLADFNILLKPVLGCIAVAPPARQSFRSNWLGAWGGNLDYNRVVAGMTIFLPVFQEGALLFIGDGHASQGDGEINGDALETSTAVELTVDLLKGESSQGPRFEDDEYLMASGIAGSLQAALRQATTELLRWLEKRYQLSSEESQIVLGSSVRYDLAVVVNPQMHIVARISKAVLATLGS